MPYPRPVFTTYKVSEMTTLELPKYTVQSMERPSNVMKFESYAKMNQYVTRETYQRRTWTVQIPYFTNLQRDELDYFFLNMSGILKPFKWWNKSEYNVQPQQMPYPFIADLSGILHIVRFGMETLHFDRVFKDAWSGSVVLVEAHPMEVMFDE